MILFNNQIISPGKFRTPQYSISPFSTEYVSKNYHLVQSSCRIDNDLLSATFGNYIFCESGKSAIYQALKQYNLLADDEVYIVTTTGNKYISGCVTQEIEKFCKWSRKLTNQTKLIYVNHEFGVVYKGMAEIKKLGIPIIEDMAMSMFSTDNTGTTGTYGDFTIYSLPKFFPLQFGGVLKINNNRAIQSGFSISTNVADILGKLLSYYLKCSESIRVKRLTNHRLFSSHLKNLGFHDRFTYEKGEIPSVYMFSTGANYDLHGLKSFIQENGVEASVFYGEQAFFLPVHQYLDEADINFIVTLIEYFFNQRESFHSRKEDTITTSFSTFY